MGRSGQTTRRGAPAVAGAERDQHSQYRREVHALMRRVNKASALVAMGEQRRRAQAALLGRVSHAQQVLLVRAANESPDPRVRRDATTLLLLANYGFIYRYARKHQGRGLDLDALRAECETGLLEAIPRFNHELGVSFLTFAEARMHHRVSTALRQEGRPIRLPKGADQLANRIGLTIRRLEGERRTATPELVARELDVDPALAADLWPHVVNPIASLDVPVGADGDGEGLTLAGTVAGDVDVAGEVVVEQLRASVQRLVDKLPPLQRYAIEQLYLVGADDDAAVSPVGRALAGDLDGLEPLALRPQDVRRGFNTGLYALDDEAAAELSELTCVKLTNDQLDRIAREGLRKLRPYLTELREEVLYRGPNALEHSEHARELVREELHRRIDAAGGRISDPLLGELTHGAVNRLKPGRGVNVKGQLREVAERQQLVDVDSGRLHVENFTNDRKPAAVAEPGAVVRVARPRPAQVSLRQLVDGGELEAGEKIFSSYKGRLIEATITESGAVRLANGREFSSLSTASGAVSNEQNGWAFWKTVRAGKAVPLRRIREQHRDRVVAA